MMSFSEDQVRSSIAIHSVRPIEPIDGSKNGSFFKGICGGLVKKGKFVIFVYTFYME